MTRKRSNPKGVNEEEMTPSKCRLHNREAKDLFITPAEEMKLSFCKEENAFQCKKTDCEHHVEAVLNENK